MVFTSDTWIVPDASRERSAISDQRSAISDQRSAISDQRSAITPCHSMTPTSTRVPVSSTDEHSHRIVLHEVPDRETERMEHRHIRDAVPVGTVQDDRV